MNYSVESNRLYIKNMNLNKDDIVVRKKFLKDYPLHWHDCFELELILSGSATQILNGKKYELQPGDIYLLNPTDFHEFTINEETEIINVMIADDIIDEKLLYGFLKSDKNVLFRLNEEEFLNTKFLLELAITEFNKGEKGFYQFTKNIIECLFITLMRKNDVYKDAGNDMPENAVHKALLYMHGHFRENPSMEYVANLCGFNPSYFSSLFHKVTSSTYKTYITNLKLEYAKKLALSSSLSVTEICYSSGFNSLSHFLREYKNKYKQTVSETRKNAF